MVFQRYPGTKAWMQLGVLFGIACNALFVIGVEKYFWIGLLYCFVASLVAGLNLIDIFRRVTKSISIYAEKPEYPDLQNQAKKLQKKSNYDSVDFGRYIKRLKKIEDPDAQKIAQDMIDWCMFSAACGGSITAIFITGKIITAIS